MNPQVRRLALDLGPLLIFFAAFRYLGIFGATACFMVAIAVALGLGYFLERRLSPMPLWTQGSDFRTSRFLFPVP